MTIEPQVNNINIYVDGEKVGSSKNISYPISRGYWFEYYYKRGNKLYFRGEIGKLIIEVSDITLYESLKIGNKYEILL